MKTVKLKLKITKITKFTSGWNFEENKTMNIEELKSKEFGGVSSLPDIRDCILKINELVVAVNDLQNRQDNFGKEMYVSAKNIDLQKLKKELIDEMHWMETAKFNAKTEILPKDIDEIINKIFDHEEKTNNK